jgi:hypothetical protein
VVELILNAGQRGERKSIRNPWALGSEPWTGAADWGRGLGSRTAIEHFELVSIDIYLVLVSTSAQVRFHAVQSDTDSACRSLFARPQRSAASGSTAGLQRKIDILLNRSSLPRVSIVRKPINASSMSFLTLIFTSYCLGVSGDLRSTPSIAQ